MRTIKLKTFDEPVAGMPNYSAILKLVVNTPLNAQRGFDANDMRQTIKILDKIDDAIGELLLEDEEWSALKTKLGNFPFAIAHRGLLECIDDVNGAEP